MKKATTTKQTILKFEKCYEIDIIYHITELICKNENDKNSTFWIAYFKDEEQIMHFEIYRDSKLIQSHYSYDYSYDEESFQIFNDSLDWISDNIGEIVEFDCLCYNYDKFFSSMNIIAKYGLVKPEVNNKYIVDGINTKLFNFEELMIKSYGQLLIFFNELTDIAQEFEDYVEEKTQMEIENKLIPELEKELNIVVTALDYIYKNIQVCIEAMKYQEDKTKLNYNEFTVNLN
jgi:hypothetical protein